MDEQLQQQAMQYVAAIMQGGEQAVQQIQQAAQQGDQAAGMAIQLLQAAQQGDQQAQQMIAQIQQQMQAQQAQMARFGAKLNYIKYLRGKCPEGYEMQYFKKGGAICNKCVKKKANGDVIDDEDVPLAIKKRTGNDTLDNFRKNRLKKKMACGGKTKKK